MSNARFRTRIKFCGLTRAEDVRIACDLGVDAIGLVFAARSKRRLDLGQAAALRLALDPMMDAVALFMDNTAEEVDEVIRSVQPSLLQFHGSEEDAFCRTFGRPYLKAIAMGDASSADVSSDVRRYPAATGFLFDSHSQGAAGGSGKPFDWSRLPKDMDKPFLLAGGLSPDNVFDAIRTTSPWGVDVSSGIEHSPGIKDSDRMRRFVEEVRRADSRSG